MTGKQKRKPISAVKKLARKILRRRRKVWTRHELSEMRKLRRKGATLAALAKRYRRGPGQIYQLLYPRPAEHRRPRPA